MSSKPYHSFYIMIVLYQYTDNRTTSAFACRTRRSRVTCQAIHSPYGNCHLLTNFLASMQFANIAEPALISRPQGSSNRTRPWMVRAHKVASGRTTASSGLGRGRSGHTGWPAERASGQNGNRKVGKADGHERKVDRCSRARKIGMGG